MQNKGRVWAWGDDIHVLHTLFVAIQKSLLEIQIIKELILKHLLAQFYSTG